MAFYLFIYWKRLVHLKNGFFDFFKSGPKLLSLREFVDFHGGEDTIFN